MFDFDPDGSVVVLVPRAGHIDRHLGQSTHVREILMVPSSSYWISPTGRVDEIHYNPATQRWNF